MAVKLKTNRTFESETLVQRSFYVGNRRFVYDCNYKGQQADYLCSSCFGRKSKDWHGRGCKVSKANPLDRKFVIRVIGPEVTLYKGLHKIHVQAIRLFALRY